MKRIVDIRRVIHLIQDRVSRLFVFKKREKDTTGTDAGGRPREVTKPETPTGEETGTTEAEERPTDSGPDPNPETEESQTDDDTGEEDPQTTPDPTPPAEERRPRKVEYEAIGRVGPIKPVLPPNQLETVPAADITGGPANDTRRDRARHVDRPPLEAQRRAPSVVRNMHELGVTPLAYQPAVFRVAEASDTDVAGEPDHDLGADFFSYVARTINLKIRRAAHRAPEAEEGN